jgi:hypothetical protein
MTTNQIAILAVASGTVWTILIVRAINYAADRIIEHLDELKKR